MLKAAHVVLVNDPSTTRLFPRNILGFTTTNIFAISTSSGILATATEQTSG